MAHPRVLLADNHLATLETIASILSPNFDIVGKVGNGQAVIEVVDELHPDIIVLDISMPIISGIDVARTLKELDSSVRIVFVTVHDDPDFLNEALEAGGLGYVIKTRLASDLLRATKEALLGRRFISPSLFEAR